ncbi:hypothetical protein SAZ10_21040 [Mesorhizobium sp. BAC0120]|uniref:hypothetical protein n=1 Tax=Mesorhizobium sp. BAC0120 TaxID=3090670 RepID=UPI00298C4565|nr:hypothetical protein [Mesorhizobium sp. BAC0120]MDW6024239.1 hypothetical protein [Mesorhizobium sp. BAC0120]
MRITPVAARVCDTEMHNWMFVHVEADEHGQARHLPHRRAWGLQEDSRHGRDSRHRARAGNPLGPIAGVAALHFGSSTCNVIIQEELSGAAP